MAVQNLEKNYRDFQFRVTHLDPVIEPEMHQRDKCRIAAQMQKEPTSSLGSCLCIVNWFCGLTVSNNCCSRFVSNWVV